MTTSADPKLARSLGVLLADLAREAGLLLRQQAELFKAEIRGKLSRQGRAAALLAAGGLLLFSGWLVLLAAATLGLANVLPAWLAALLVALATLAVGYGLLRVGTRRLSREDLVPHRTLAALRGDAAWLKQRLS